MAKRKVDDIQRDIKYMKEILSQIRNGKMSKEYCTPEKESEALDRLTELQRELGDALFD